MSETQAASASGLQSFPVTRQIRRWSPSAIASSSVTRTTSPLRLPSRISWISSLNGLSTPSWVEITSTLPPHMRRAMAAFSSSSSASWKAASSKIT